MGTLVRHRNTASIWLFDYNQFDQMDDCPEKIVCLSERDINLIWNAIQNIWTIQSRVYIDANGDTYEIVDSSQWETFVGWVATMRNNLGAWTVCNDYLASIAASLDAIANRSCCPAGATTGSRGAGSSEQPPDPYDQAATPTEPPSGFADMATFEAHKCDAAEDLLNNLKADLIGLSGIVYSGQTPTGLVGALILFFLTPIPFDDLIALAAYLIYSAFSYTFLAEMSAEIGSNQDELRCILYNSDTSESAKSNLLARLEEIALATFTTTDDAEWVMGAVEQMIPYDATNVLFENLPTVSNGADCLGCAEGCTALTSSPTVDFGTDVSFEDGILTITSVLHSPYDCGDAYIVNIYNIPDSMKQCGFEVSSGSLTPCGTQPIFIKWESAAAPYDGPATTTNTFPGWVGDCAGTFAWVSETPFIARIFVGEAVDCGA